MVPLPNHPEPLVLLGNGPAIQPVDPGRVFAREAEPLDRLSADVELIDRLMWAGYDGPEWKLFRTALAQYGVAVLYRWTLSGRIFVECERKGLGALPRRKHHDRDDALGIAGETVARAFLFFRDRVLVKGVWDPARGASVRTYFVGACVLHFPNEYRRALGGERLGQHHSLAGEDDMAIWEGSYFSRPDARAELASDFRAIRDTKTREIVLLKADGYAEREIARMLGTSRKAVESRLYRLHQRKL
jgi:DNA-directed RNA polymerase specialized sigma24 family protein